MQVFSFNNVERAIFKGVHVTRINPTRPKSEIDKNLPASKFSMPKTSPPFLRYRYQDSLPSAFIFACRAGASERRRAFICVLLRLTHSFSNPYPQCSITPPLLPVASQISSPRTPGTPPRLDNPSHLCETPPDMGAPRGRLGKEKKYDWPFSRSAAVSEGSAAACWIVTSRCMSSQALGIWPRCCDWPRRHSCAPGWWDATPGAQPAKNQPGIKLN